MSCPINEKCKISEDSRNVITCNRCMADKILKIKQLVSIHLKEEKAEKISAYTHWKWFKGIKDPYEYYESYDDTSAGPAHWTFNKFNI